MGTTNYYQQPTIITAKKGNNALDFDGRLAQFGKAEILVPSLQKGNLHQIKIGQPIVFEAQNDEGEIISCHGLENFIELESAQKVYIFDNHNHAFYFWHLEWLKGNVQKDATLIHIDQHKDTRKPEIYLSPEEAKDLQKVYDYTNLVLNVGNFIPPAQQTGLVKNIIFIESEKTLEEFDLTKIDTTNLILDIDVDFFAPELDYINNNLKISTIKKLLPLAKTVTIATSPFFIDQKLAIEYIHKFFAA